MVHIIEHDDDDAVPWPNRQPASAPAAPKAEDGKDADEARGVGGSRQGFGSSPEVSSGGGSSSSNEAEEHKSRGNECFAEGRWEEAEKHYTLALEACPAPPPHPPHPPQPPSDLATTPSASTSASTAATAGGIVPDSGGDGGGGERMISSCASRNRPRAVYHANRAACYMSMERYKEAAEDCTDAIAADDVYVKAYLRRGAAREKLEDLEGALADNEKVANELETGHKQAAAAVARLRPVVERKREEMKEEMMGKLKDLGNSILGNFGLSTDNFKAEKDAATGSYNIQFVQK